MATIRPYQPKDRANMHHICIQTGPAAAAQPGPARTTLLATYCDYYIDHEPQNCFVIADEQDCAVGYIICAQDYHTYYKRFMQQYAPRTKGFSLPMRVECLASAKLSRLFVKQYPAHLHIDILPSHQRMGLGSQLMNTLCAHLRAQGVPGVMLGVGSGNKKGRNFYNKYGFHTLLRIPFSVMMGLKL